MKSLLRLVCLGVVFSTLTAVARADVQSDVRKLQQHLVRKKFDAAEKLFKDMLETHKGTRQAASLRSLHRLFAIYYARSGKYVNAGEHWAKYVDVAVGRLEKSPQIGAQLPGLISQVANSFIRGKKPDVAFGKLDEYIAKVAEIAKKTTTAEVTSLGPAIQGIKVLVLNGQKKKGEAQQLLKSSIAAQRKALEKKPKDVGLLASLNYLKDAELKVATTNKSADLAKVRASVLKQASSAVKAESNSPLLVIQFTNLNLTAIGRLVYQDAKLARKIMNDFEATMDELLIEDRRALATLNSVRQRRIPRLRRTVVAAVRRANLIGQPSMPLEVDAWVNGKELTDKNLKGKVIMLDFWAVWCGPCIRTFPHLREWQEKYAKDGLEIIGVTRYYQWGWDEKRRRPKRSPGIAKEDERAAMVDFAKHHKLKHRFAVAPFSFGQKYHVTGIPQVVLIDRKGKIRLIRVGSGPESATQTEAMIKKLLAEK